MKPFPQCYPLLGFGFRKYRILKEKRPLTNKKNEQETFLSFYGLFDKAVKNYRQKDVFVYRTAITCLLLLPIRILHGNGNDETLLRKSRLDLRLNTNVRPYFIFQRRLTMCNCCNQTRNTS